MMVGIGNARSMHGFVFVSFVGFTFLFRCTYLFCFYLQCSHGYSCRSLNKLLI